MATVRKAYSINAGGFSVVFGQKVMEQMRAAIYHVLKTHEDELVQYMWTLNDTYIEDGKQVVLSYEEEPTRFSDGISEKLLTVANAETMHVSDLLFTPDTKDREAVRKLCREVALGNVQVDGVME